MIASASAHALQPTCEVAGGRDLHLGRAPACLACTHSPQRAHRLHITRSGFSLHTLRGHAYSVVALPFIPCSYTQDRLAAFTDGAVFHVRWVLSWRQAGSMLCWMEDSPVIWPLAWCDRTWATRPRKLGCSRASPPRLELAAV